MATPENITALSDTELLARYRHSGDQAVLGILYERYGHLVFGVCMKYLENREDSRDATTDIFVKLISELKKHDIDNFKSWLYSVAKNHCLMKFRKDKRRMENRPELLVELTNVMEWDTNMHLESGENTESRLVTMEDAILQLPEEQRLCIELFYLREKSYREVVEQTGFDYKQVKSFIQNGKRNLKNLMNRNYEGRP